MTIKPEILKHFAEAFTKLETFEVTYKEAIERREREILRRMGIHSESWFRSEAEAQTYFDFMCIVDEELGINAMHEKSRELEKPVNKIVRQIKDEPVFDLQTLAIKANAVATAFDELWTKLSDDLIGRKSCCDVSSKTYAVLLGSILSPARCSNRR